MHLYLRTTFLWVRRRACLLTSLSTTYQILALKEQFLHLSAKPLPRLFGLPASLFLPHWLSLSSLLYLHIHLVLFPSSQNSVGVEVALTPLTGEPLLLFFTAPGATYQFPLQSLLEEGSSLAEQVLGDWGGAECNLRTQNILTSCSTWW
jgi:hypothetical protein